MKKNLTDFFIIEMLFVTRIGRLVNTNNIWEKKRNNVLIKVFTMHPLLNQDQV